MHHAPTRLPFIKIGVVWGGWSVARIHFIVFRSSYSLGRWGLESGVRPLLVHQYCGEKKLYPQPPPFQRRNGAIEAVVVVGPFDWIGDWWGLRQKSRRWARQCTEQFQQCASSLRQCGAGPGNVTRPRNLRQRSEHNPNQCAHTGAKKKSSMLPPGYGVLLEK